MALFVERGYVNVTVAEIAGQAGLTRRTFFNHFADKREIFFSGAAAFRAGVLAHLNRVGSELSPVDAAVAALTGAGVKSVTTANMALQCVRRSPPRRNCRNAR